MFIMLVCGCCFAQIEVLPTKKIGVESGLSNSTIWCVLQNKQGYLWVGTSSGANRYDGYEFQPMRTGKARTALNDDHVRTIHEQEDGFLWMGTAAGLTRYDPVTGRIDNFCHDETQPNSLSNDFITVIVRAGANQLWIGTDSGLNLFHTKSFHAIHYNHDDNAPESLSNNRIRSLWSDSDGTLWVGTDWGLNRMDPSSGRFTTYYHDEKDPHSLSHNQVRSLCRDGSGDLWIGTSNGISILRQGENHFQNLHKEDGKNSPIQDNWINVIETDQRGRIWIGTRTGGLSLYDPLSGNTTFYRSDDEIRAIPTNNIISLYFDNNDLLWVGTYTNGLIKFDLKQQKFKNYRIAICENMSSSNTNAIYQSEDQSVYLGTTTGLSWRDPKTDEIHKLTVAEGLSSGSVVSIIEAYDKIWLGTYGGGAVRVDPKKAKIEKIYRDANGQVPSDVVNAMLVSPSGEFWLGTRRGLARYDKELDRFDAMNPKLAHNNLLDINPKGLIIDRAGRFWLGTHNGLWLWDPSQNEVKTFETGENGLCSEFITQVLEDSRGRIWVGTSDGLNLIHPDSLKVDTYQREQGLQDNWISAIAEGQPGEIWISGNMGLTRFRQPELFQFFDFLDGLQGSEFMMGSVFSNPKTGMLFFGGINGYNAFYPSRLPFNPTKPRLALTAFRIFDSEVNPYQRMDEQNRILLHRRDNFFSFEFAGLDFTAPEKNNYAYRLKGFETAFNQVGTRRYASYTNIPGGDYLFQVMVANSDGIWTGADLEIPIRIFPFFWETTWFRVLAILGLGLCMLGLHAFRLRRVRARQRDLAQDVDHRTAALREVHQRLLDDARKAGIAEVTTGMLHNMGNILNSVSISASEITRTLRNSKWARFQMANELMRGERSQALAFFEENPKGRLLPLFFSKVTASFRAENLKMRNECQLLMDKIGLMSNAISMEQSYAGRYVKVEDVQLAELMDHALRLMESSLEKRNIEVIRELESVPNCYLETHKLVHVLTNLVKNAIDALSGPGQEAPKLRIRIRADGPHFNEIQIRDNGCGISPDSLDKIFEFGFTTKVHGNGFGLHSCRATMRELGGDIWMESAGLGKGVKFTVRVPLGNRASKAL